MIRINLLPVRGARKREFGRQQLVLLGLVMVATVLGNLFWINRVQAQLTAFDTRIAQTKSQIAELDKTIGQVNTIKDEKKALESKLEILDTLKKGRTGPVQMMDELAQIIPPHVWLDSLEESNGRLSLAGKAVGYEDLTAFSHKLKASKHFKSITIVSASQAGNAVRWTITCQADYNA